MALPNLAPILLSIRNQDFSSIYFLQGEETYFIDQIVNEIVEHALTEEQRAFNQTIVYGKDISKDLGSLLDISMRLPMMAERQLVVVKEAQHIRSWDVLSSYIQNPNPSTILVFAHMNKKIDGRSSFSKLLKKHSEFHTFSPLREYELPKVIDTMIQAKNLEITPKSSQMLIEFLGNDLSKIENEIQKLSLVVTNKKITPSDIEENIGISKDYNVFELQNSILQRDATKVFKILNYFKQNPKAGNIVYVLTILYGLFSKLYTLHHLGPMGNSDLARALGVSPFFIKDYKAAVEKYSLSEIIENIKKLSHFDLRSKGLHNANTPSYELLKELCFGLLENKIN